MKGVQKVFVGGDLVVSAMFACCALVLLWLAGPQLWEALWPASGLSIVERLNGILETIVAALLLIGWGVFLRCNRSVEELEPEAMERAKDEDARVIEEGA